MSKVIKKAKKELEELEERRKELFRELKIAKSQNGSRDEFLIETQCICQQLAEMDRKKKELETVVVNNGKNEIIGKALIRISVNNQQWKEVTVIIKEKGIPETFVTDNYVISEGCKLHIAIAQTKINNVAIYRVQEIETAVFVLDKNF